MPLRPTFAQVLNSTIPRDVGLCSDDQAEVAFIVNEAQEHLIADPMAPEEGWWGSWVHATFNLTVTNLTATLTTPREIARIDVLDICKRPRRIRNGFYEYLQFTSGLQPRGCNPFCSQVQQAFDRDRVPLLSPFPTSGPQILRFYPSNNGDVGKRVLVQGPDQNGKVVYGVDPDTGEAVIGEQVPLVVPFATALNQYQNITGLMKDPTLGPVLVFAVDPVSGAQTQISSMEPNEVTADYRQYFFNGLPANCCNTPSGIVQIDAMCRLDFIPVVSASDPLFIQSLPAIAEEVQAVRWSKVDSAQALAKEAARHKKALTILCGQIDMYEGKVRTAISCKIFGSDPARLQPI